MKKLLKVSTALVVVATTSCSGQQPTQAQYACLLDTLGQVVAVVDMASSGGKVNLASVAGHTALSTATDPNCLEAITKSTTQPPTTTVIPTPTLPAVVK